MQVTRYEPGNPCWVGLSTTDLKSANAFYAGLFGWDPRVSTDPKAGGYTICHINDMAIAGIGPVMDPDQPTAWTVFFSTHSADATAQTVELAGGKILAPPMDVMDSGRMAVFMDPGGAIFAVWQALAFAGAEVRDEPGALCWAELMTRDVEDAKDFYAQVFGWGAKRDDQGGMPYLDFTQNGESIGGMLPMEGPDWPPDLSPHWMAYFEVDDCEATAARAVKLGGAVPKGPTTIPPGQFAIISDPQGAPFGIFKNTRTS